MTDPALAPSGRVCPSCGRRVPQTISLCRCGARLGGPSANEGAEKRDGRAASDFGAGFRSALAIVAAIGALGFGIYALRRPPARAPQPLATLSLEVRPPAAEPAPATAPPAQQPPAPAPDSATAPPTPSVVDTQLPETASLEDVVSRVMPAVVLVETPEGRGSAFFVTPDTLLTNVHVVGNRSSVTIRRMDGSSAPARVEATSLPFDIAVLKVAMAESSRATIPMGSSRSARVGQEVFAIGSALGTLQNTVTRGIVSGIRQSGNARLVQTDAAVNPGNSGGPLLDRTGTAIGLATMGYGGLQGLNFAVAIEHARPMVEGRPAQEVASATTVSDLKGLTPAVPSDTDRIRADGLRAYEQTLDQLTRSAQAFDNQWRTFRESCYGGRVLGTFDHEWFALLSDRALPDVVAQQCVLFHTDLRNDANAFRDAMLKADEDARRAGVYPGPRRDARRQRRLESDAWDR